MRGVPPSPDARLDEAFSLYNARRYREAARLLASELRRRPGNPQLGLWLAHAHRSAGEMRLALAALRRHLRLKSGDPAALLCLGEILKVAKRLLKAGRQGEAEPLLRRLAADPAGPASEAGLLHGAALAALGRRHEAARVLHAYLEQAGPMRGSAPAADQALNRARACLILGDLDAACAEAERVLDAEPSAAHLHALLQPLEALGSPIPSRTLRARLASSAARFPDRPWPRLWRAELTSHLGCNRDAYAESAAIPRLHEPRYAWMRHARGLFLLRGLRDYGRAAQEFNGALRVAPQLWAARVALVEIQLCLGRERAAQAELEGLLRRSRGPERAEILARRGEIRLWTGWYAEALADFEEAAQGGATSAHWGRGAARLLLGRPEEALLELDAALQLVPGDEEALLWRAETRRRLGRTAEAARDLDAAVSRRGRPLLWTLVNRALVRAELGDQGGMRSDLRRLAPWVVRYLERASGISLGRSPRPDHAIRLLDDVLRLARGFRRTEAYLQPVWMGADAPPGGGSTTRL